MKRYKTSKPNVMSRFLNRFLLQAMQRNPNGEPDDMGDVRDVAFHDSIKNLLKNPDLLR